MFTGQLVFWLWFTVLFANFAEAVAEGRGKAQADALRETRSRDRRPSSSTRRRFRQIHRDLRRCSSIPATSCWWRRATSSPATAKWSQGVASVDESAITGESAPVIRESRRRPLGRHRRHPVLSDWIKVKITAGPGSSFLDRMISLVEGAKRQKTPNEIALYDPARRA